MIARIGLPLYALVDPRFLPAYYGIYAVSNEIFVLQAGWNFRAIPVWYETPDKKMTISLQMSPSNPAFFRTPGISGMFRMYLKHVRRTFQPALYFYSPKEILYTGSGSLKKNLKKIGKLVQKRSCYRDCI